MRVPHDPDGNTSRRAIRATVVVPTLFGLAVLVGSDVVALYVLFGSFTMLVFGDFGGATHHRITAYVATAVAGLGLIVVGTALSQSYVAAAIVAFFVAFALTLGAVIGPAVGQLRTPLVLAFVLPASVPAPFHDVDERLLGWTLGGAASVVAALLLFHVARRARGRDRLRRAGVLVIRRLERAMQPRELGRRGPWPRRRPLAPHNDGERWCSSSTSCRS